MKPTTSTLPISTLLTARWKAVGGEPDTSITAESRRGTHWLVELPVVRPSIPIYLRALMKRKGWSQAELSRRSRIHIVNLNRLCTGGQQSCAPETRSKLGGLAEGDAELLSLFESTNWGPSANPNQAQAAKQPLSMSTSMSKKG
jgi:hypothetical protein